MLIAKLMCPSLPVCSTTSSRRRHLSHAVRAAGAFTGKSAVITRSTDATADLDGRRTEVFREPIISAVERESQEVTVCQDHDCTNHERSGWNG